MGKYIEAYKGGASGNDVLKKVKELKRHRHRSAPVLNSGEERRGKYDRKRGENALNYFKQQENASPKKLGSALARHTGEEESTTVSHLFQQLSIALMKGNASLLNNRNPSGASDHDEAEGWV